MPRWSTPQLTSDPHQQNTPKLPQPVQQTPKNIGNSISTKLPLPIPLPSKLSEKRKLAVIEIPDTPEISLLATSKPIKIISQSSPVEVAVKKQKRVISDSEDSEGSSNLFLDGETGQDQTKAVKLFNEASFQELQDLSNCTYIQFDILEQKRPFRSYSQLVEVIEQTKGLRSKLLEDLDEAVKCYSVMDAIIDQCLDISADLEREFLKFSEVSQFDTQDELHFSPSQEDQSVIRSQPSTVNSHLKLKDYQMVGLNWLWLMHRKSLSCILAFEQGLGKTALIIVFFALLQQKNVDFQALVVVPTSTMENWVRECAQWCPTLIVKVYSGSQGERAQLRNRLQENEYDILLTTYSMFSMSDDRKFFKRTQFSYMILDEGHLIKNIQSQRYKNLMSVRTSYRILLTGTPLQNSLQELLALLVFIMPDLFADSENELRRLFSFKNETQITLERIEKAKKMLAPFILRRKKVQVLKDLPSKYERVVHLQQSSSQRSYYQKFIQQQKDQLSSIQSVGSKQMSNIVMQLRKLALHPLLAQGEQAFYYSKTDRLEIAKILFRKTEYFSWSTASSKTTEDRLNEAVVDVMQQMDYQLAQLCSEFSALKKYKVHEDVWFNSVKIQAFLQILNHHAYLEVLLNSCQLLDQSIKLDLQPKTGLKEKVLVFSQFVMVLDIIEHCLLYLGIKFVRLDGATPVMERQVAIDSFDTDPEIQVFLLTTRAGGVGLNLMAASVVVLFDMDFNPFNDLQAEDRVYRIGQTRDVVIYKLVVQNTIEERIYELAQKKITLDKTMSAAGDVYNEDEDVKNLLQEML